MRVFDCKQDLLAKNYRQHLLSRHPAENPQDLSPFGQSKLSFFSGSATSITDNTVSTVNTLDQVTQPASTAQKRCRAEVELIDQPIDKASKLTPLLSDVNVMGSVNTNREDDVKETHNCKKLDIILNDLQEVKNNLALLVTAQGKSTTKGEDFINTFHTTMRSLLKKWILCLPKLHWQNP